MVTTNQPVTKSMLAAKSQTNQPTNQNLLLFSCFCQTLTSSAQHNNGGTNTNTKCMVEKMGRRGTNNP